MIRMACIDLLKMHSTTLHGALLHELSRRISQTCSVRRRGCPQRLAEPGPADRAGRQDRRCKYGRGILFRDFDAISATSVAEGARALRQPVAGADRSGAIERLAGPPVQ